MIRLRHKLLIYLFRVFDLALMVGTLALLVDTGGRSAGTGNLHAVFREAYRPFDTIGMLILAFSWVAIFSAFVRYDANRFTSLTVHLVDVLKATSAAAFALFIVSMAFSFSRVNNLTVFLFWVITSSIGILSRVVVRWFLIVARRSGYNYRHLLIIGCNQQALDLARRINQTPELGYKIVGFIKEDKDAIDSSRQDIVGSLSQLKDILEKGTVDEIIVCLSVVESFPSICEVIRLAQELGVVARLIPEASTAKLLTQFSLERFEGDYIITLFRERMLLQLFVKRLMDLAVSALMLVVLSPLLVAVALIVKFTSPGPVLFVQERIGMNRRKFKLYKFRSMVADAEQRKQELAAQNEMDGPAFKIKNDPRVTPIGRFIRKTSIDELPQLLNVFCGHMSLVGPRPPLPSEVDQYEWLYRKRLSIKPGLTCLWQISGRNNISFKQWMQMDREYIENWSIWLDLEILAKTVPVVILGRGAS